LIFFPTVVWPLQASRYRFFILLCGLPIHIHGIYTCIWTNKIMLCQADDGFFKDFSAKVLPRFHWLTCRMNVTNYTVSSTVAPASFFDANIKYLIFIVQGLIIFVANLVLLIVILRLQTD
jgi:hypothetical protein